MPSPQGIHWTIPPERLADQVRRLEKLLSTRVGTVVHDVAEDAQRYMRLNRPWADITGNARRGLRVEAEDEGRRIIIYFIHGVEYGIYLEMKNGGRYAILFPTLQRYSPILRDRLKGLL